MVVPAGRYRFGPENGRLLLRTGRQGVARTLGHDLTLEATSWSAEVEVGDGPATGHVVARVTLASLSVVQGEGGATPLTAGNRQEIDHNAQRALDVGRYPEAVFESTGFTGPSTRMVLDGTLTLHGSSGPQRLELEEQAPNRYRARGTVLQSEYGIKPYSAMFGALRLRDSVEVEVDVEVGLRS